MDTENVVVTKQDRKYKTLVTDIGKEKMTNAILNGKKVNVVMAAGGDGCQTQIQIILRFPRRI